MFGQARGCCSPDGHCRRKAPRKSSSTNDCKQIAFDHQKGIQFHFDLPVIAVQRIVFCVRNVEFLPSSRAMLVSDSSPPDLHVLHSTFLI